MGVIQENRVNTPKPDVKDTGYGVKYVNVQNAVKAEEPVAAPVEEPVKEVKEEVAAPRRGGRQRKIRKGE